MLQTGSSTVYVHYPFCGTRCGYCSFPTTDPDVAPQEAYADAVLRELEARAAEHGQGAITSVYLGGGTPSLWREDQLARVVEAILDRFDCAPDMEVTVEANPSSLGYSWLERLWRSGVNRLSLGVQSLDDEVLAMLDRSHTAAGARQAVAMARAAGVENLGCDVIFGVPGQSLERHLGELEMLAELSPDHISTYGLTLAPNTSLRQSGHAAADDDRMARMMESGRGILAAAGYCHYEVSNYCRPSRHSRHNSSLWAGAPYLGLGAFAHSARHEGPSTLRQANPGPEQYLELWSGTATPPASYGATVERVDEHGSRLEVLMLGLRAADGVSRRRYRARFGADLTAHYGEQINRLAQEGLVRLEGDRLRPTGRGIWFADELALRILDRSSHRPKITQL